MSTTQLETLAPIRHRGVKDVIQAIFELQKNENRLGDFQVFTYPVVRQLGRLIEKLSSSEQEGNTREVLRQVRDTFLDGGWESYRSAKTREAVIGLLDRHLGQLEEVEPGAVKQVFEALLALRLRPVAEP